jgi:hypothetical protein
MGCKLFTVIVGDDDSDNDDDNEDSGFRQYALSDASTLKYEYGPQSPESEIRIFLYQKITLRVLCVSH